MVISMLKIRRPLGRLIFNMGIAIPGKIVFLIETAPRALYLLSLWVTSNGQANYDQLKMVVDSEGYIKEILSGYFNNNRQAEWHAIWFLHLF